MYKSMDKQRRYFGSLEGHGMATLDWHIFALCDEEAPQDWNILMNLAWLLAARNVTINKVLQSEMVNNFARAFRTSEANFTETMLEYIERLYPPYSLVSSAETNECHQLVHGLLENDPLLLLSFINIPGFDHPGNLPFGEVMREISSQALSDSSNSKGSSLSAHFIKEINRMYSFLWPNGKFPAVCLYYYLAGLICLEDWV